MDSQSNNNAAGEQPRIPDAPAAPQDRPLDFVDTPIGGKRFEIPDTPSIPLPLPGAILDQGRTHQSPLPDPVIEAVPTAADEPRVSADEISPVDLRPTHDEEIRISVIDETRRRAEARAAHHEHTDEEVKQKENAIPYSEEEPEHKRPRIGNTCGGKSADLQKNTEAA